MLQLRTLSYLAIRNAMHRDVELSLTQKQSPHCKGPTTWQQAPILLAYKWQHMREPNSEHLWRKNPCWLFHLKRSLFALEPACCFLCLLLDVFQEGCPGIHNCFEGIFTARRYTFVWVKQYSQLPVGLIDFLPVKSSQAVSNLGWSQIMHPSSLDIQHVSRAITSFSQR